MDLKVRSILGKEESSNAVKSMGSDSDESQGWISSSKLANGVSILKYISYTTENETRSRKKFVVSLIQLDEFIR
jgi:hypothetical protein